MKRGNSEGNECGVESFVYFFTVNGTKRHTLS